jgi:hypothetical protein
MKATPMIWTGRVMTGLVTVFMLGASIAPKFLGMPIANETMQQLGWPPGYVLTIGVIEFVCLALYLYPRTNVLGAVLFTALLGGAMATHIRAGSPLFSHILFGVYLGVFVWGGLWLRDPAVRQLFPWRREAKPSATHT